MKQRYWLACTTPAPMLKFLRNPRHGSNRKLRLFSVACCRRAWELLTDEWSRRAVEVAERYADGLATEEETGKWTASLFGTGGLELFDEGFHGSRRHKAHSRAGALPRLPAS